MDIGSGTIKVMQLSQSINEIHKNKHVPKVIGYGFTTFDKSAQKDGVIVKHDVIAEAAHNLFKNHLIGDITTKRVAIAIPAYRTFTRSLSLPKLNPSQLKEAVELEAEQYVPLPLEQLYLDYDIIKQTSQGIEVFIVAVPKEMTNSYLELGQILDLETVLIEPTLSSSGRLFSLDERSNMASFIIDFGSLSADISIYDKHILVTGTVQGGGVNFTESIKGKLGVTLQEAALIKTRYGLNASKKQTEIKQALEPTLGQITKEIKRMIRYYEERYGTDRPIGQIITLGGGANMPGLTEYLTEAMRLPVRSVEPWTYLNYKGLQPPAAADKSMFSTVAGLSLTEAREVFA